MAKKIIYSDEELTKIENRLAKIRTELCEESNTIFAEKLGIAKQTASNLIGGQKSIGKKTIEKVLEAFPNISKKWLILGEGDMYTNNNSFVQQSNVGDHNSNSGNITNVDERLLKMLEDSQKERLKLLTIIENLTSKQ